MIFKILQIVFDEVIRSKSCDKICRRQSLTILRPLESKFPILPYQYSSIYIANELFQNYQESIEIFSNLTWAIGFAKKYSSGSKTMDFGQKF